MRAVVNLSLEICTPDGVSDPTARINPVPAKSPSVHGFGRVAEVSLKLVRSETWQP
jgi:hypothetical protein